jgi:hypothetical protein
MAGRSGDELAEPIVRVAYGHKNIGGMDLIVSSGMGKPRLAPTKRLHRRRMVLIRFHGAKQS